MAVATTLAALLAAAAPASAGPVAAAGDSRELPMYKIPNLPENGEAYYAPDGVHLIAQVKDPDA
ncbi:MAG: hypothetical protein OEW88_05140, partial [Gammaproteobacteria bacterium]|nr:hypothetical protein [Gammaproteobacteria bacterium]